MRSKRRLEGEVLIDHRASPGTLFVPGGQLLEAATLTCPHCQRTWVKNPLRTRPRNWCHRCDHYICDDPGCLALKEAPGPCEMSARLEILRNDLACGGTPPSLLMATE